MVENFPTLEQKIDTQIHEVQKTPNKLNLERAKLRHIIIKLPKIKDKEINLK